MVTREEVIAEIQNVPEGHLDELYRIIKESGMVSGEHKVDGSIMASLRKVKIEAAPDFSINANLYDLDEQNAK
jgi:hypothetical protein